MFLVEIHRELGKKGGGIVACGTSERVSKALKIRVAGNMNWIHRMHPAINHDMAMIDCVRDRERVLRASLRQSSSL